MKKAILIITIILVATVIIVKITDTKIEIEKTCGGYMSSDYVNELGEKGKHCEINIDVKYLREKYPVKFEDEWIVY
jgi:hypothetical protein